MKATAIICGKGDTMPIFHKVIGGTGDGNITPICYKVICKKGNSPMGGHSPRGGLCVRVYDQQNNFLGILVQQFDAKFGRAKYLLPNTKAVTEEMLHQFPDTWEASIVGHGLLFDIQQAAVVEFVAPWEVIFQELRLQLSNPATHDDAVAEILAGMSAMKKLGRLLVKE